MMLAGTDVTRRAKRLTVTMLAVLALGPAACGGETTEEDEVRSTVREMQEAFVDKDVKTICSMLSKGAERHIRSIGHNILGDVPLHPCKDGVAVFYDGLEAGGGDWRERTSREVTDVRIRGDSATATVSFGGDARGAVPLVRERGEWRIDALFGGVPGERQLDHF